MKLTTKRIIKEIGNDKLSLYHGEGYWYFVYDDPDKNIYADHAVMTFYLNDLKLQDWIDEGNEFLASLNL